MTAHPLDAPIDGGRETEMSARARPAIARPVAVVLAACLLGLLGQLLFFELGLGINLPLFAALVLAAGWLLRRPGRAPAPADLWLAPAGITFAAFAAVRADGTIVALDALTAIALSGAAVASFAGLRISTRPLAPLVALAARTIGWLLGGATYATVDARRSSPRLGPLRHHGSRALPVLRGLGLALPLLLIFVVLFASADAVFASMVEGLLRFDLGVGELPGRLLLALALGWLAGGALSFAAADHAQPADVPAAPTRRLGLTETLTVLAALDALFALFVILQAAYLFGGVDTLATIGMSYSDYARRGFFELLAVAGLAGLVIATADRVVRRRTRWFVALAIGLALMTAVVLLSAAMRLRLYQEAYGWTELRFYVLASICWLGIGVALVVTMLATDRMRWLAHGLIAAGLVIGLVINVVGPVRFITEHNVARALDPGLVPPNGRTGVDEAYLTSLGDDAVPGLVRLLPALPDAEARYLAEELAWRLDALETDPALRGWPAWNLGREAARVAMRDAWARGELP